MVDAGRTADGRRPGTPPGISPGSSPGEGHRHAGGRRPFAAAHRGRRPPGAGREPSGRRGRERPGPAALGERPAHGRRRDDRRLAGRHALLRRDLERAARQRRPLPARDDGALRDRRPRDRAGSGPVAAGPPVGAGSQPPRPRRPGAGDAAPLRRPVALPGGARGAGPVEGAQRPARGGRAAGAAARHVAHLGERPAVGVRSGHGSGRRRCRRRHRGDGRLPLGARGDRGGLPGRRRVRPPAPPPRRRAHRRAARRTCSPPPRSRSGRDGAAG